MERVWVVSRGADESWLVVGVFDSAAAARRYVDGMTDQEHAWEAPRPGHQHWTAQIGLYRYLIEEHPVRSSAALLSDLDLGGEHVRTG